MHQKPLLTILLIFILGIEIFLKIHVKVVVIFVPLGEISVNLR